MKAFLFNAGVSGLLLLAVGMCVSACDDTPKPEAFLDGTPVERYEPWDGHAVGPLKGPAEAYYRARWPK